ncbi:MAG: (2Fe-2S)-binding protein [Corynebacterium sp.]|nr:(2Fe-2S)-binding protein [Corynebacterium sp.]
MSTPQDSADQRRIDHAINRMLATFPRYAPCVDSTLGRHLPATELASEQLISRAIAASRQAFKIPADQFGAQVWLFSLLGSVGSPAMATMVLTDAIIDLDLGSGVVFNRDEDAGYWFGFRPGRSSISYEQAGQHLGESLAPVIATICRLTGMRPAPLWAVVADGVVQPAVGAGNADFEQFKAMAVARAVHRGLQAAAAVKIPPPRFEQIIDDEFAPVMDEEPEFLVAHRGSCCMIYHGADADYCASCPHVPKKVRLAGIIAAAEKY